MKYENSAYFIAEACSSVNLGRAVCRSGNVILGSSCPWLPGEIGTYLIPKAMLSQCDWKGKRRGDLRLVIFCGSRRTISIVFIPVKDSSIESKHAAWSEAHYIGM